MTQHDDSDYYEEKFSPTRKEHRKEKKLASSKDRSKYKKTDKPKNLPTQDFSSLPKGRVIAISKEAIIVSHDHKTYSCTLRGLLKKERNKQKNLITIGDFVRFELSGIDQGVIAHIEERKSILSRRENLHRRKEQMIAVNIDQVLIVVTPYMPRLKPALIDRYIIAAIRGNMKPVIIFNKVDLIENPPTSWHADDIEKEKALIDLFLETYSKLEIPILLSSSLKKEGIEEIKQIMDGKTSVFSGQSGVGKTSLINNCCNLDLDTKEVISKTRKGAHSTSSSILLPVEKDGFCIDTPGIKSFDLWDITPEDIQIYYDEFTPFIQDCKFPNCMHLHEPDCRVKKAVDEKQISQLRYNSYCTLVKGDFVNEWE